MASSKKNQAFCMTSYKKWLVILSLMIVGLVVYMIVGFDEDRARGNLTKIKAETDLNGGHHTPIYSAQMTNLQNSYSQIAAAVREVTVNIEASRRIRGGNVNNGGANFANPFGANVQQVPGNVNNQGPRKILGVAKTDPGIPAPPIPANAVMLHEYRGVCTNCHTIVDINAGANQMAGPLPGDRSSIGSGIIFDSTGLILTNYHIVTNANNIIVTTANGNRYHADVKFTDVPGDLAILKIGSVNKFPTALLGDSSMIQEGDIVLAVGNQFGLSQTVTSGIISDVARTVTIDGSPVTGLIQTDAAINRGSSGGPLVNIKGEVIGVNTAIYSLTGDFTGIGFAIPINRAKEAFGHIPSVGAIAANIFDLNIGEVITIAMQADTPGAWFGAEVIGIDPIMADQFGLHNTKGVFVNSVFPRSPAIKAGLERGDVIKSINGRTVRDVAKFQKIITPFMPGDIIDLTISRNNQDILITAQLENIPKQKLKAQAAQRAAAAPIEMEWAGMEVTAVTPQAANKFGIAKGTHGVVVVEPEGMAAAAGIVMGDVIIAINRKPIDNMADFSDAIRNVTIADGVLFDVLRQGKPLYITM